MFERNLAKIGIRLKSRLVDFSLFRKRLETFDFDMVMIKIGDFTLPEPAELKSQYGSANADVQGADNYRGVKSRAIDHVLEAMEKAQTMEELTDGRPRARPPADLRLLPGAGPVRRHQPRVALGQVRHSQGRAQVLHDRDAVGLVAVGDHRRGG